MRAIGLSLHHPLPRISSKPVNWEQKLHRRSTTATAEDSDEQWHRAGRMVDKSMPVLRKRLKEIKALDRGTGQYSMELVELEDGYCHTFFSSEMLELLGLLKLQSSLSEEESLPKLLIGFSVMLTVNLPVPVLVAVLHLKDAAMERKELLRKPVASLSPLLLLPCLSWRRLKQGWPEMATIYSQGRKGWHG